MRSELSKLKMVSVEKKLQRSRIFLLEMLTTGQSTNSSLVWIEWAQAQVRLRLGLRLGLRPGLVGTGS